MLRKYRVYNDVHNYVLLTKEFGCYQINDTDREVVNELHEFVSRQKHTDFGLAEKHCDTVPELLYYDIDLLTNKPFSVSDKFIISILKCVHKVLVEFVISPNLESVVTIKGTESLLRDESHYKFGLHIYFPFVCLFPEERMFIYEKVIQAVSAAKLFDSLDLYEENIREIIDYRVIRSNAILLYGCNKPGTERYQIYKVYDEELNEITPDYNFIEVLSIRKNLWLEDKLQSTLTLSIGKEEKPEYEKEKRPPPNLDEIRILVDMLSINRASNYSDWVKVGLCLHNIDDGDETLSVWANWSNKCPDKSKKTNFKKEWKSFKQRQEGLNFGSLIHWAKLDSPEKFAIYNYDKIVKSIKSSLLFDKAPFSTDIAKVLRHKYYKKKFICSNIKANIWYEFRGHRWFMCQEGNSLYNHISDELIKEYQFYEIEVDRKVIDVKQRLLLSNNESETNRLKSELEDLGNEKFKVCKLIDSLKKSSFKKDVLHECRHLFYDENFDTEINNTKNIIVFNNGVFDLDALTFRNGEPGDYSSFSTNNNYSDYDENNPDVQKVYDVFSQIHPNKTLRDFFFYTLASALHGYKREQKFDIWTGVGSNGKSITVEFISKALGDYFYSPSIQLLTRKRGSSSNASPELIKLKGIRIAVLQEPEFDDQIHPSLMKQLTGNDWIEARELYCSPIKFKPQLSLVMACNDLPKVPSSDGGTWRRMRVLQFKSKFVDNPTKDGEYPVDPTLQSQIETLGEAFMSILIHYYNKLKKNKNLYKEPPEVNQYTSDYKKDNDVIQDFIDENVEEGGDKDHLKTVDVYNTYLPWLKENYPNTKPLNKLDFKRQLCFRFGELSPHAKGWHGYRMKDGYSADDNGLF